jgi:hypothetical protein
VAVLHENARDVAHGLIAPERLIVTPNARLVIVEHVLGAAIEQLQYGRDRLWQEFRVAMPPSAGLPRFDHRADVTGMGLVSLALILGRPLAVDEYPHRLPELLNQARERSALGEEQPLSPPLRSWLERALQIDVRRSFASAPEAMAALEEVVSDEGMYVAAPVALETFLSRYIASLLEPTAEPIAPVDASVVPVVSKAAEAQPVIPEPAKPVEKAIETRSEVVVPQPIVSPVASDAAVKAPEPSLAGTRELTDLLGPEPLPMVEPIASTPKPLFNPDAPFTATPVAPPPRAPMNPRAYGKIAALVAAVLVLGGGGVLGLKLFGNTPPPPAMGSLNVQSNPAGVDVFVDGVSKGRTPARIAVAPGSHILELRGKGVPRVIPLNVTAGAEVSQYLEFAEAPVTGQLAVQSDPPGAKVLVDGVERGVAPVTISDLTPGDHKVELQSEGVSAKHTVTVQAGGTASLVAPLGSATAAGPVPGWVTVKAPFTTEIREQGRIIGTSDADRLMIAAGRHELDFVNDTLGYKSTRVVIVAAGKVSAVGLDLPMGVVNLNAAPWAEVWIDGKRVGETPIGNLAVSIGPHDVVFKHPQLGEKHHPISVTLGTPVRLSVDMK